MVRETFSEARLLQSLAPAARTATANGSTVDRASGTEFYQHAMVVVATGTITDGTHTITIEDSDDGSDWDVVAAEDLQGSPPAIDSDDDDSVFEIGYLGLRQFLRAVTTVAGATTGGVYAASVVLSGARHRPPDRS